MFKFVGLFFELTRAEYSEKSLFDDNIRLVVLLDQSHDLLQIRELHVELALELASESSSSKFELKVKKINSGEKSYERKKYNDTYIFFDM